MLLDYTVIHSQETEKKTNLLKWSTEKNGIRLVRLGRIEEGCEQSTRQVYDREKTVRKLTSHITSSIICFSQFFLTVVKFNFSQAIITVFLKVNASSQF